jgi:broad specificity phosphatase PhoE
VAAEPRLLLVRHGESEANVAGLLQGQSHGALTPAGRRAAEQLAAHLASLSADERPTSLLTSDLRRAAETADIVSRPLALVPEPTPAAREWHVGELDGHPASALHRAVAEASVPYWEYTPVGGESLLDVRMRASRLVASIEEAMRDPAHAPRRVRTMLVTHGDFIRMMLSMADEYSVERAIGVALRNTSVTELALVGGGWRVVRIDDARHVDHRPTSW